jgi:hypothetical protein
MYIIPIVIYCLAVALFIFGLTFHDELLKERQSRNNTRKTHGSLIVIDGGKHHLARRHSRL